jgi:hypothetical protein
MLTVSNNLVVMSSVELVEIINSLRPEDAKELRHDNFMAKIEKHPGIDSPKFLGQYKDSTGRSLKCYRLPKREAELMVMSESLEVQARVYDRMLALEALVAAPQPTNHTEATAALLFWDAAVKSLNIAPSGHLGGVRAIATTYGYAALLPHLPNYAIDAPTSSTTGSSEPTASASTLLKKHDIKMSTVKFNTKLVEIGLLADMTRPSTSSPTGFKTFKAVVGKGLDYGKNVTNPGNPRETQPHWYSHKFLDLIDLLK